MPTGPTARRRSAAGWPAPAAELLAGADLIAPVPLHRWRLLKRGYNQAAILARALAREAGVPLVPDLLQRRRATRSQQGLSGQARLANITAGGVPAPPLARRRACAAAGWCWSTTS